MPEISGYEKWASCGFHIESQLNDGYGYSQSDGVVFGCIHPEMIAKKPKIREFHQGTISDIAIIIQGKAEDPAVLDVLNRICDKPCPLYSPTKNSESTSV